MLEVIHVSDTHFGPDRSLTIRGANAFERAEALVAAIRALPFVPDFIVHTGDVVNDPDPAAYALAAEVLADLPAPVYYATGNHDDVPMMRRTLAFGELESIAPELEDCLCYRITGSAGDKIEVFVLDGKVPPSEGPHGYLGEAQINAVLDRITGSKPVAIFLHYPLVPIGSKWIDEHLLVTNGLAFQRAVMEKAGGHLRGIFSGHLHRGLTLYRDGVLHSGVSSPACEFSAAPGDTSCEFIPGGPIPFHHITFTKDATMVKAYSLPFSTGSPR